MQNQRTVGADQGSAFAHRAGVPWWGAVLIAVMATLVGFAIEAGSGRQELGTVFAVCYALGCIAAVVTVRRSAIFTAIIQPPLLLFVAVPLAYFLLHGSAFNGLKDIAISCGYPLIERFPLMLFTSAAALLIGLVRWYLAMSAPVRPQGAAAAASGGPGLLAGLTAKLSSAFSSAFSSASSSAFSSGIAGNGTQVREAGADSVDPPARARHGIDRPAAERRPRRARQPRERTSARSRQRGPRIGEGSDAPPRPRRESTRRAAWDDDRVIDPPRRRPREPRDQREPRRTPPPPRREPRERRDHRGHQDWGPEPWAPGGEFPPLSDRAGGFERRPTASSDRGYRSRPAYDRHSPDPYPPRGPRRRPTPETPESNRHPVSRVRYRGSGPDSDYPEDRRNRPVR